MRWFRWTCWSGGRAVIVYTRDKHPGPRLPATNVREEWIKSTLFSDGRHV